ncbi:uridine kinase [Caproiciproducens sp. LBM24188]|nr:uridine kinase [Oscillospiraceae bacterium]HHV31128.1 uridine kinase [Clostridiales bacterium]
MNSSPESHVPTCSPFVIGVAGGTGSGKTTLATKLQKSISGASVILSHDFYYRANSDIPFEERVKLNYDHPNAFDTDLMIRDIKKLKSGQAIDHPQYSFVTHTRLKDTVHVEPAPVIIVEGILIFENQELLDLMDIKVFVDADADIRLIRRLTRDVKERGRSLDSVIHQYMSTVKPMHEQFVEPSKKNADIIIPQGGENRVALHMLIDRINALTNHTTKNSIA